MKLFDLDFELYVVDCETTGLDSIKNDPIEISIYRLSDDVQKTWNLKPINFNDISTDALRVNGHKIEDLKGFTKEGRERYQEAAKVLIEIENFLMEDGARSDERLLVGQNISFDKDMLIRLWDKCNSSGTFPFSKKYNLDTMQIELFLNLCRGVTAEGGYSLKNLTKKYGVINSKAHSAAADTLATKEVFVKQVEYFTKIVNRGL